MNKQNISTVLWWEFKKHIKSPVFLLFTFLIPALIAASGFLPAFVMHRVEVSERDLWILDETSQLADIVAGSIGEDSRYNVEIVQGDIDELKDQIEKGEANGILHITQDTLDNGTMQLYTGDLADFNRRDLEQMIQPAYTQYRLAVSGISPAEFVGILIPTSLQMYTIEGEEDSLFAFIIPFATGMLLFLSVLFSGQVLMQSVIKEKRNRIVEILLSTVTAAELLTGKVLAFGALAFIQIGIWVTVGLTVASRYVDLSGVGLDYTMLITAVPYYVLGYLLLATLFAATAATMKDAESGSQAHGLVIMIPVLPIMLSTPIMMAPDSLFVRIMSFIPIFTPATMLLRLGSASVPLWEILATLAVLAISMLVFLRLGAKIYEGSLLKFDTAAGIKDILGMLKKEDKHA